MIDTKKFTLFISLCAVFAVSPVLANAPKQDNSDLGADHNVYVERSQANGTLPKVEGYATNGIASVSYVNRMVDAAGNAADAAEKHAAAAGAYAISAAESADEAKGALSGKQAKSSAAYQMGNAAGGWTTMTTAQQNALNSGINADKVTAYEGYATGKQDKLTTSNIRGSGSVNVTVDNGVITVSGTDKDTTYSAGSNVSISNGAVSVATANGTTLGVVKAGSNVSISSGAVSVADATATVKGVAKLGVIPSGTNKTGTAEIWVE